MGIATASIWAIISLVSTVGSMAYQQIQAKKARERARDAEEARKGFELVTEGDIMPLPIVYGKALIGGIRVWHATKSTFHYTETNADKWFATGPEAVPGGSYTYYVYTEVWDEMYEA